MAVWQVTLNIVNLNHEGDWQSWPRFPELCATLSNLLPPSASWNENLLVWGNSGFHEADIWKSGLSDGSFRIRIDLREHFIEFENAIENMLATFNLKIMQAGNLVDPKPGAIRNVILNSKAFRFVSDPVAFMNELVDQD